MSRVWPDNDNDHEWVPPHEWSALQKEFTDTIIRARFETARSISHWQRVADTLDRLYDFHDWIEWALLPDVIAQLDDQFGVGTLPDPETGMRRILEMWDRWKELDPTIAGEPEVETKP